VRRLSSLGSRQLSTRKGRSLLTALGIVLGVAVLVGVLVSNATTQAGVDRLVVDIVGRADVAASRVGGFDASASRDEFLQLLEIDDVEVVAMSLRTRSAIRIDGADGIANVDVALRGIDQGNAAAVQPITLAEGTMFTDGADEAVLPIGIAEAHGVEVGDPLALAVPSGEHVLTVVGILDASGIARSDDGDVVFTSTGTLQRVLERPEQISGARIVLTDGIEAAAWIDDHEDDLGPGFEFQDAEELGRGFQEFLSLLGAIFTVFAAISLFIGAFLIYLTLTTAVVERTRIYGTLRALGASRRQIRRLVLSEAAVLGIVSAFAGVGLGLLIATGLLSLMEGLFEIDFGALEVTTTAVVTGFGIGVVTTLLAAFIPARRAARLEPTQAMLGGTLVTDKRGKGPIVGAIFATLGLAGALLGVQVASPILLIGAVLVVPLILPPLARVAGFITERIVRGLGPVAILHLVKERSRSGYTLGLVMTVMGTIFAIAGLSGSMLRAIDATLDAQLGADLLIDPAGPVDPAFDEALRRVPGVEATTAVRFSPVTMLIDGEEHEGFARIVDPATIFDVSGFIIAEGTLDAAEAGLARGSSVLMPSGQAKQHGFAVGDAVTLDTAEGQRSFEIVATYSTLLPAPELVLNVHDGIRYFGTTSINLVQAKLAPGFVASAVIDDIEAALGDRFAFEAETISETKQQVRADFNRFFAIFYAIVLIAGIVGLLGMANTLAVSVLQRTREVGVLRAIGASRRQVRVMVVVESLTMSIVAFLLSLPLGLGLGVVTLAGFRDTFGLDASYVYPVSWTPTVAIAGVALAVIAAFVPARRAARLDVVAALAYE
jgi:putative ABC transport system permease protein